MPSRLRRTASWLWTAVDRSRRVAVNVLFLVIVVGIAAALLGSGKRKVPAGAALVVAPKGRIVEQLGRQSNASMAQALVSEDGEKETLLRDLVDALLAAKTDSKISSVYLDLSDLASSGMTTLEDLRAALAEFRSSGKKVVAYADHYTQAQYYVATAADEVWLSPVGEVSFQGLARFTSYFKETLDRLQVDVHVFRVGEFKSAVEPYLRTDASPEAKEADLAWMSQLWNAWLRDVAKSRGVTEAALSAYVANGPALAESVKGDFAKLAIEQKLVDKLGYRDQVTARMIELAGEDPDDKNERTFRHVASRAYVDDKLDDRDGRFSGGDAVAVLVASGEIVDGKASPGRIGGDSLAELIRKTRHDKKVKAIVLRVDSPGGSAFASEVIRRELVLARNEGKKVIVSMGSVAASGGYWISTASDEIWASPETITGSIGIFGIYPTVDRALDHFLGVHTDGVGTTPYAGQPDPTRPLPPELGRALQQGLDHGYEQFLARVAEARKMKRDDVDKIARGRVWSGADGKRLGLVDQLGGLKEAITSAGKLAGLGEGFRVYYPASKKKWYEGLVRELLSDDDAQAVMHVGARPSVVEREVKARLDELERLATWNDPQHVYAWCGCDVR